MGEIGQVAVSGARVRLLGPVDVVDEDGFVVALGGPKERLVLAVLAVHAGEVVSEDRLVDALWGESPPRTAAKTLQSYISRLRKTLAVHEGLAIESAPPGYVLRAGRGGSDVAQLDELIGDARAASAAGEHERAAVLWGAAERLWRGPVLGELAGEPFAVAEAARLEELRTVVIEERVDAELAAGRHGAVVAELESLTARYPLRERLWKARMLALYRCGRQADALRAFQELRAHLSEELGIDPTPELVGLEQAILVQSPDLAPPAPSSPQPVATSSQAAPGRLPSGVVTFLLTDVEGSTALWERHGTNEMDDCLRAHDAAIADAVAAHGGVIIKARGEGDSTFSVFWRATDAACAAVAAQTAIAELSSPVPLRVRAAVHTGEAVERDGNYYGPAVNRAARLRDVATGGETLLSRATADLVADHAGEHWDLVEVGKRQLKDLARAETVWALLPAGAASVTPPSAGSGGGSRPPLPAALSRYELFVARDAEQARLEQLWQETTGGARRAVFIAGEPGIGKTALAAAIAHRAYDAGAIVVAGRCDEGLGVPHQAFAEAARALITDGSVDLRTVPGSEELARLIPELPGLLPDLGPPAADDAEASRWRLFEAVTALFARAAQASPVVLVLDDLHWAEQPTLLLLRHLLRTETPMRLLVIGTYRDTELARTHPLADLLADLRRDGDIERISLAGFEEDDVARLIEATAGHDLDQRAQELAGALRRETAGNPFFCAEVLRHLAESGTVFQHDGRWTSELPVDQLALPEGVREVIGRRLSRLPDTTNEALRVAAVIGAAFTPRLLEAVVELSDDELLDALDAAVASGLVNEAAEGYEFAHALVRHTLLAELTATRTTRLHRRIGQALEAEGADRHIEALARHWLEAADGHEDKAATYALAAAHQANDRAAYEEAEAWAQRGLEALDDHPDGHHELRADLWTSIARSYAGFVSPERGQDAALRAADHARLAGDTMRLAIAARWAFGAGLGLVNPAVEPLLHEALGVLGNGEHGLRAQLLAHLSRYRANGSDRAGALEYSEHAVAEARRSNDPSILAVALTERVLTLHALPGDHEGFALAEDLAGLRVGVAREEVLRVTGIGSLRLEVGDRDGYEACLDELAAIDPTLQRSYARLYENWWRATRELLDGRWDSARAAIDTVAPEEGTPVTPGEAIQTAVWGAMTFILARELGHAGPLVAALRAAHAAIPGMDAFRAVIAMQLAEDGEAEPAQRLLDRWMETGFTDVPDDATLMISLTMTAETAVRLGHRPAAEVLRRRLEGFAGRLANVSGAVCMGAIDRFRAMLAAMLGEFDKAEALFESALSLEENGMRSRPLATRTRFWYGRMLVEKGDAARAQAMLWRARRDAEELSMAGIAAEAAELLSSLDSTGEPCPSDSAGELEAPAGQTS